MGQELLQSDLQDIRIHLVPLGEGVNGFVYVSGRNVPHIFLNESLSPECTMRTLAHEVYHLKYDKTSHGIGLDKQREESELRANRFAIIHAHKIWEMMNPTSI